MFPENPFVLMVIIATALMILCIVVTFLVIAFFKLSDFIGWLCFYLYRKFIQKHFY